MDEKTRSLVHECREKEFHAFGTSKIFEKRAKSYRSYINLLTFFGIVTPLLVGAVVLSFGSSWGYLPYVLGLATIIGLAQLVISVWSITANWSGKLEVASNAVQGNVRLYNEWKALADHPDEKLEDRVRELRRLNQEQEVSDLRQDISEREKRFAMHESLFYYKKACQNCGQIPKSKDASKCDMCGNY
jgi:mobilome CxxCx(11)CxxC protein